MAIVMARPFLQTPPATGRWQSLRQNLVAFVACPENPVR
jgi:hypothetical protein